MRRRIRSEATESLHYLMDTCVQVPVRKFAERLPTDRVGLFDWIIFSSLMCTCVGVLVYWCACIEVWPSHTTSTGLIWPLVTSVDAPYVHLHPPSLASKTVLSSWCLVVMSSNCTREVQAGTRISGRYQLSSYHALYKFENIGYVEVPEDHLYNTQNSKRSDAVSTCLMVACVQVPVRKLLLLLLFPVSACYKAKPGTLTHYVPSSSCSRRQRYRVIWWLVMILGDSLHLLLLYSSHHYY